MLKRELLILLSNLPNTQEVRQRKALLALTEFEQLLPRIDMQGDNYTFFTGLIEVLISEGQLLLLEFIKNLIESPWSGLDTDKKLTSLHFRIAELNDTQWHRKFITEIDRGQSPQSPQSPPQYTTNYTTQNETLLLLLLAWLG